MGALGEARQSHRFIAKGIIERNAKWKWIVCEALLAFNDEARPAKQRSHVKQTFARRCRYIGNPLRWLPSLVEKRHQKDGKPDDHRHDRDRKSTRLNSSHLGISY